MHRPPTPIPHQHAKTTLDPSEVCTESGNGICDMSTHAQVGDFEQVKQSSYQSFPFEGKSNRAILVTL